MSIWGKRVDALVSGASARTRVVVVVCAVVAIAVVVVLTEWRAQRQADDLDCLNQRTEVLRGERVAVDSDCVGR
jgi:membrane protein implicated in regulation of membrane protease activity